MPSKVTCKAVAIATAALLATAGLAACVPADEEIDPEAEAIATVLTPDPDTEGLVVIEDDLSYADPIDDHVVTDKETGVTFADNELMVYFSNEASYERIAQIVQDNDAQVVGAFMESKMFQLRFSQSRSYEELEDFAKQLEILDEVDSACMNVGVEMGISSDVISE